MKVDNRQNVKISNSLRHFLMHKKPRDLAARRKSMHPWVSRAATGHAAASDRTVTTLWIQALCCVFMRVLSGLDLGLKIDCGVALIFLTWSHSHRGLCCSIHISSFVNNAGSWQGLETDMEPNKNLGVLGQLLFPHHSRTSSEKTSLSPPWIRNSYLYVNSFGAKGHRYQGVFGFPFSRAVRRLEPRRLSINSLH